MNPGIWAAVVLTYRGTKPDDVFFLFYVPIVSFAISFLIRYVETIPRKWEPTQGQILESTFRMAGKKGACPTVWYEFDYQGRTYQTDHWRIGNFSTGFPQSAEAIQSRYTAGAPVTVYIKAKNPMKSVLETSPSMMCWVPVAVGFLFLSVYLLIL